MSLGSDILATLPYLRAQAESRMTETVQVGSFEDGTDPVSGDATRVLVDEKYAGVGRIKYPSSNVSVREGSGQVVADSDVILSIPVGAYGIREGDEVVVVSSTVDPSLGGRIFRVEAFAQSGQVTAHRFTLSEKS